MSGIDKTIKGFVPSDVQYDGSNLRVCIVHARWNKEVIDALIAGAVRKLKEHGVKQSNIVLQSVPGSYELPLACKRHGNLQCFTPLNVGSSLVHFRRIISAGQIQASTTATDLMGGANSLFSLGDSRPGTPAPATKAVTMPSQPFDAVIAIGVLIKGSTMHFEYICDAVSHGLMRVQLDTGVPVVFGVLTALSDDQALERAGLGSGLNKGHNHGEDWGLAAVEMASHTRKWAAGKMT
jgi:6,7-dimethyl-8-ribityllumazine synthase